MKVSVTIITYNQSRFIRKAIDSALDQHTNFPYEILVGDDCSTDDTRAIIREYEQQYPGKVIGVYQPHNLGQNGLLNCLATLEKTRGEYYAIMDGDDYWTDPHKLQKQVDYLDAHPSYSAVFNNALITYEDGSPSHLLNGPDMKPFYTLDDLIGEQEIWFMASSGILFRKYPEQYPDWFRRSISGDIPRLILKAKVGPIGYLPDVMSVYRKNRGSASYTDDYYDEAFLRNRINMYSDINKELGYKYNQLLTRNIARYYRMLLDTRQCKDNYFRSVRYAIKYLSMTSHSSQTFREIIRDYIVPKPLMKLYSTIRLMPHRNAANS